MSWKCCSVAATAVLLLLALPVGAQNSFGRISGAVTDPSGAAIGRRESNHY